MWWQIEESKVSVGRDKHFSFPPSAIIRPQGSHGSELSYFTLGRLCSAAIQTGAVARGAMQPNRQAQGTRAGPMGTANTPS